MSEEIFGNDEILDEDDVPFKIKSDSIDSGKYSASDNEVRVTKLVSYYMCAYKAEQPSVETYQTAFGTAVHEALSLVNNGAKEVDLDALFLRAKTAANITDEKLYKQLCDDAREMFQDAPTYHEKGQIVETRLFYNIDKTHVATGSPDIAFTVNPAVRDYKTGRIKFTPHTYPQLPFYAFLLMENGYIPKHKDVELEYLFIRDNESSKEVWSYEQIMKVADILISTWIKHEGKRNLNMYCRYCHNIFNCPAIMDALNGDDPVRAQVAKGLINLYTENIMFKFGTVHPGSADLVKVDGEVIEYMKVENKKLRKKYPGIFKELAEPASFSKLNMTMMPIIDKDVIDK
jgi:hypothetical protein